MVEEEPKNTRKPEAAPAPAPAGGQTSPAPAEVTPEEVEKLFTEGEEVKLDERGRPVDQPEDRSREGTTLRKRRAWYDVWGTLKRMVKRT